MPFTKGHKLSAKGGARKGAGRKSEQQLEVIKAATEIARELLEKEVRPIMESYVGLAVGKFGLSIDPPTTRHAVDWLRGNVINGEKPQIVQFLQFNQYGPSQSQGKDHDTSPLSASKLSATVLEGDVEGDKKVSEGVASAQWQGQD